MHNAENRRRTNARNHALTVLTLLTLLCASPQVRAQCEAVWDTAIGNAGPNSTAWSLHAANGLSAVGPLLYVGGQFSAVDGTAAKNIASWDGSAWAPLGTGAENGGVVYAMTSRDGILYAGGAFGNMGGLTGTKRIAKWNGSAWSDVGGGMSQNNAGIRALAFLGNDLYAGGYLNEIGGIVAHKLARWDGAAWAALPGDPLGSTDVVKALTTHDDGWGPALYVGGEFPDAGGDAFASNIFRWDGATLQPLGRGTNDEVATLCAWNGDLYVGGHFTRVYQSNGTELVANKIARWDGTSWHALGDGMNTIASYYVWSLAPFDDGLGEALYAGGSFTTAGGIPVSKLAMWDGAAWSAVDSAALNGYVYALSTWEYDGGLHIGGTFTTSGSPSANRIVRWGGPLPASPLDAQADPNTIVIGESTDLTVVSNAPTVSWYADECGETWVGDGNPLTVSPTETKTYYARTFDGSCWSYACASAAVTVDCAPPAIITHPIDGVICDGHSHELCVTATGDGTLTYQWKRNGLALIGATASCYTATQAGTYWCVVTDNCGPVDSDTALVSAATPASGDFTGDGAADLDDFTQLLVCLAGPDELPVAYCACTDADTDGDTDVGDLAVLQVAFTSD